MAKHFKVAFEKTMVNEGHGVLTNNKFDPGGMTYSGVSRHYWPEWEGWYLLDNCTDTADDADAMIISCRLDALVRSFYRVNFWNRIKGDALAEISPAVAYELFDTAVNVGVTQAVTFLQTAYNIASAGAYALQVDGRLGPKTVEALARYLTMRPGSPQLNEEILLNCMNGEQYIYYKNNPKHEYFRGWFARV